MVKMNFTDKQVAFEYAIYMIVGSYFRKTTCRNVLREKKMRLQYCGQKPEKQYEMEELCMEYAEEKLLPMLPEEFWNADVQVRFGVRQQGGEAEICFAGPKYALCVKSIFKGRKTKFQYKLWAKKQQISSPACQGSC